MPPVCPLFTSAFHHLGRTRTSDCADFASCQQNETDIFAPEALTQQKAGPTQTRLNRSQRQRNLAGALPTTKLHHRTADHRVLLIDDVVTTGATLY
jgi:predicted amidophosphoribosyltransferase